MIDTSLLDESLLASLETRMSFRADEATEFCAARIGRSFCPNPTFGGERFCGECRARASDKVGAVVRRGLLHLPLRRRDDPLTSAAAHVANLDSADALVDRTRAE